MIVWRNCRLAQGLLKKFVSVKASIATKQPHRPKMRSKIRPLPQIPDEKTESLATRVYVASCVRYIILP